MDYQKINNWHLSIFLVIVLALALSFFGPYVYAQWQSPNNNPPVSEPGNIVVNPMTEDLNLNGRTVFGDNITLDSDGLNVLDVSGNICFYGTNCIDSWSGISGGLGGESLWSTSSIDTNNIYYNAGNVGIGTNDPKTLLHISKGLVGTRFYGDRVSVALAGDAGYPMHIGDDASTAIVNIDDNSASSLWTGLRLERGSANNEKWFFGMQSASENLVFRYGSTSNYMTIDSSGRVGVNVAPVANYQFKVRQTSGLEAIHGEGPNTGIYGKGDITGVKGYSSGSTGYGVYAENTNANGVGLKAVAYNGNGTAAQFDGRVELLNNSYFRLGHATVTPSGSCASTDLEGVMIWDPLSQRVYVCDGDNWRKIDFTN